MTRERTANQSVQKAKSIVVAVAGKRVGQGAAPGGTMRFILLAGCVLWFAVQAVALGAAEWKLSENAQLRTATGAEGQAALSQVDLYIEQMSAFDLAVRLKTAEPTTREAYLRLAASQVRAFTEDDEERLNAALELLLPRLARWQLPWPRTVLLIKTAAAHEAGAAYCRGAAIVLPESRIARRPESLADLLAHELFHVLSNQNPKLRGRLYALVGFESSTPLVLPEALAARKLTNPDAPALNYYTRLTIDGREALVAPLIYAEPAQYDPNAGKTLFEYLQFRLLEVEPAGEVHRAVLNADGEPRLHDPRATPAYFEKIGRNTPYIIHPEEVLADNFMLLVRGEQNVPTPDLLRRLDELLSHAAQ